MQQCGVRVDRYTCKRFKNMLAVLTVVFLLMGLYIHVVLIHLYFAFKL